MKKLVKLTGALALVAFFAGSAISTSNAQEVTMDDLQVIEVADVDALLVDKDWELVSSEWVWRRTVSDAPAEPASPSTNN